MQPTAFLPSEQRDSNSRPLAPQTSALPTAPYPVNMIIIADRRTADNKIFVINICKLSKNYDRGSTIFLWCCPCLLLNYWLLAAASVAGITTVTFRDYCICQGSCCTIAPIPVCASIAATATPVIPCTASTAVPTIPIVPVIPVIPVVPFAAAAAISITCHMTGLHLFRFVLYHMAFFNMCDCKSS